MPCFIILGIVDDPRLYRIARGHRRERVLGRLLAYAAVAPLRIGHEVE